MLYEITGLQQSHRSENKRWFSCRDMDLFIWFRCNLPVKFQLAYNKRQNEKMISWDINHGFHFYRVDTGEDSPGHYKQTPMLIDYKVSDCDFTDGDGQNNMNQLAYHFLLACEHIDIDVADFIYTRLMTLPTNFVKHDAEHKDHDPHR